MKIEYTTDEGTYEIEQTASDRSDDELTVTYTLRPKDAEGLPSEAASCCCSSIACCCCCA